ncbi:MAG: putative Tungsten-containing formylmethanofuran dehydrogenase 2 subunit B [Promethearchaeota archaeon]|nr:MAG: putative Tungsten-containing formylmethanofuran dehydrogenase 2 subunit B [Candidatus Lokiarchaeota archaeon]
MKKITCTGCSLLCDDIIIEEGKEIKELIGACLKGQDRLDQVHSENRILKPQIRKGEELKKTNWNEALERTLELINKAQKPLLYGFSTISCEAQVKAIKLAKKIDGFIDSNSTICQGRTFNAAKETGLTISTLTEVINKSDIIVLWGFNAVESIPRLLNKVLFSRGKFRMTGREIKTLIVIDPIKTASFNVMGPRDIAIRINPDEDIKLIRKLTEICCKDSQIPDDGIAGIDKDDLERLLTNLTNSENIAIFVGQGLLKPQNGSDPLKELIQLVDVINSRNKKGRASLLAAGGHYNMIGFDHMALASEGKNHSLQFKNNELIDNEENIISKIKKEDFDLSIVVGTDPIAHLPFELSKKLAAKPIILIDYSKSATYFVSDVVLPTAITGIESGGTAFRLDNVPIPLIKFLDPPEEVYSDEELLDKILITLDNGKEETGKWN